MRGKIILATTNKGKIAEITQMLGDKYEVTTMQAIGFTDEIEETGETFKENALIKANAIKAFAMQNGLLQDGDYIISEDAGFEVEAMPNELGVYSARFMGHDTSYDLKNAEIIRRLKDISQDKRGCRYISDICVVSVTDELVFEGMLEGTVALAPKGDKGFAYDPIFQVGDRTIGEMTSEEKNAISHRGKAMAQVLKYLA